jgi:2-polyprenyl-3-methyl-5-hydroxy-6-metoxy-1,4-benzoquinol methylase
VSDTLHEIAGEFVLRRCADCGLIYLSPRPTPETISLYYPPDYASYRRPIEDERWALMRWMRHRKLVKRRSMVERYSRRQRGRLLDVGCSTGLFMNEMVQSGWQAMGVEPIDHAAEHARRRFGLTVHCGTLDDVPCETEAFDVITFWDVLEHTFSPAETLAKASALLRPGGLVVISLPNWDSWGRQIFGRHWQGFDPPRHLYVFTRQTLTAMLTQAGFAVVDWVCFMPGYFSFVMSLERWLKARLPGTSSLVHRLLSIPGMRLVFEPWFAINNWRDRGELISVFARRVAHGDGISSQDRG